MSKMFTNIGGKIKTVAKVICWLGMILCVVLGIIVLVIADELPADLEDACYPFGVIIILVGPVFSYIGSLKLYGIGELIEKVTEIEINTHSKTETKPVTSNNSILQKTQAQNVVSPANKAIKADTDEPEEWIDMICPVCKEQVSYTKTMLQNDKNLVCPYCNNEFSSQKPDFSK